MTGAGSGIGAACARLLADRGARVLIADRDAEPDACVDMVRAAVDAFGRLDIAVNNAGIGGPQAPPATTRSTAGPPCSR